MWGQALAYAYNVEFSRVLNQQMDYFSANPSADSIERVKGEIAQVKSGLVDNIDKV
jgi:vesicle-associated membrane protein 7